MEHGNQVWYENVLNIPEQQLGDWAIRHRIIPAGQELGRRNLRTSFTAGHSIKPVVFLHDTRWHELSEGGGVWMTDLPIEQWQADQVLKPFKGDVLVGGLGLGYAATALAMKKKVTHVTVVEIQPEVCDMVWPHLPAEAKRKMTLVRSDLFAFLKSSPQQFDWAFYDIWQSDSETTFHDVLVPLYRLSVGKVHHIRNWNEDVMRGQLFHALQVRLMYLDLSAEARALMETDTFKIPTVEELATPQGNKWHDWAVVFWEWVRDTKPSRATAEEAGAYYARYYRGQPIDDWRTMFRLVTGSIRVV